MLQAIISGTAARVSIDGEHFRKLTKHKNSY